jgi:hypothetical protein
MNAVAGARDVRRETELAEAIGVLGSAVMSLYGMARLLSTRDHGPKQLLPLVKSFRSLAASLPSVADVGMRALRARCAAGGELARALPALADEVESVTVAIAEAFDTEIHLRAGERLRIEQLSRSLGAQLQGHRALFSLIEVATDARIAEFSVGELLEGEFLPQPAFVSFRFELTLTRGAELRFVHEPQIVWPLLVDAVRRFHSETGDVAGTLQASAEGPDRVRLHLEKLEKDAPADSTLSMSCGVPPLPLAARSIIDAVAAHHTVASDGGDWLLRAAEPEAATSDFTADALDDFTADAWDDTR